MNNVYIDFEPVHIAILKKNLNNGVVKIEYFKDNGELRSARATLNIDVIRNSGYVPRKGATIEGQVKDALRANRPSRYAVHYRVVYFDLDCCDWRTANLTARNVA